MAAGIHDRLGRAALLRLKNDRRPGQRLAVQRDRAGDFAQLGVLVGAEGRGGQTRLVGQVALRVVGPGVADRHGVLYLGAGDPHGVALDLRLGPDELHVRPGDGEALDGPAARSRQSAANVVEVQDDLAALLLHRLVDRAGAADVLAVGGSQRPQGQALAHVLLVLGMDVFGLADVHGDRHAGVLQGQRLEHLLADGDPAAGLGGLLLRIAEVGELDPEEREVPLAPRAAPVGDHRPKLQTVKARVVMAGVALALVPDRAADGAGYQWGDHAVVETGRAVGALAWIARPAWPPGGPFARRLGLGRLVFPPRQPLLVLLLGLLGIVAGDVLLPLLEHRLQRRQLLLHREARPGLDRRAAPG